MRRIAIVGCSKNKAPCSLAQAQVMYESDLTGLFHYSMEYAKRFCDGWYILSALYGVLRPEDWIERYDLSVRDLRGSLRTDWVKRCQPMLRRIEQEEPTTFVVLAGGDYLPAVLGNQKEWRQNVETPLAGLGIGERIAWLKKRVEEQP